MSVYDGTAPEPVNVETWWDAAETPGAVWVRVLRDDAGLRFRAGEVGVLVVNTYPEKYDAMVWLPPEHGPRTAEADALLAGSPPFLAAIVGADRAFFFHADEIEPRRALTCAACHAPIRLVAPGVHVHVRGARTDHDATPDADA